MRLPLFVRSGEERHRRQRLLSLKQRLFFSLYGCAILFSLFCSAGSLAAAAQNASSPAWNFTITDPTYPIRPGLTIIYTITYENTGDRPATNAVITDTLDPQVEYLLSTRAGIHHPESHTVTWSLGTVDPGGSGLIILRVRTREGIPDGMGVINRGRIDCDEGASSETMLVTPIVYLTLLKVYKTTSTRIAYRGQVIDFDISFTNLGDTTGTQVILTDALPQQTTFISCSGECQLDSAEGVVSWSWDSVSPDTLHSVRLSIRLDSTYANGTELINIASITCEEGNSDSGTCNVPVDTTASPNSTGAPAFILSVRSRDVYIRPGDEMLYRIECENSGLAAAHSIVITDVIPDEITFINAGDNGQYEPTTRQVSWFIPILERRQKRAFTVFVRVNQALPDRSAIINSVSLTCAEGFRASAAETTTVLSAAALHLVLGSSVSEILRGQPLTFTAALSNSGTAPATDISVFNALPAFTSYVHHTGGGTYSPASSGVSWSCDSIQARETVSLSVTVLVAPDAPSHQAITNRIYWSSGQEADSASISVPLLLPRRFELHQNYPNPFNASATLHFAIPGGERKPEDGDRPIHTTLKVYNILGQEVRTLVDEMKQPGYYDATWDGRDRFGNGVASGVYFYRLTAGDVTNTKKMVLLR